MSKDGKALKSTINRIALSLSSIHDNQISDKVAVIKNPTKNKIEDAVKRMEPSVTSVLTNSFDPIKNPKTQIRAYNKSKQIVYVDIHPVDELGFDQEENEILLITDTENDKTNLITSFNLEKFMEFYIKKLGKDYKEATYKLQKKKIQIFKAESKKVNLELDMQTIVLDSFLK
jgi:hypothetical protein